MFVVVVVVVIGQRKEEHTVCGERRHLFPPGVSDFRQAAQADHKAAVGDTHP